MMENNTKLEFIGIKESREGFLTYEYTVRSKDGTTVGAACLRLGNVPDALGNIGYETDEPYRGRGHATDACRRLLTEAASLGQACLFICCDEKNTASRRVCEKLGAKLYGEICRPDGGRVQRYRIIKEDI